MESGALLWGVCGGGPWLGGGEDMTGEKIDVPGTISIYQEVYMRTEACLMVEIQGMTRIWLV